jgi:hypothetical protein
MAPGRAPTSAQTSIGVSSVGAPSRSRRRAFRRSLHGVWCAQPRNVVELLSHGSCINTSRPSAVRQASVSRPSTGPASVARSAARDESGPGTRPRRCAYSKGSVATTTRVAGWRRSHVAGLLATRCHFVNPTMGPPRRCVRDRSRVERELALGPGSSVQSLTPSTLRPASRAERVGLRFVAGRVP